MRILFIGNDFPSRNEPTKGVFNLQLVRALAEEHEVRVIAPQPWLSHRKPLKRFTTARDSALSFHNGRVQVEYPRYYYTPKVMRTRYGWFMWQSCRSVIRRVLSEFSPELVIGYWVHPDGEVAVRIAKQVGVPSAVLVGGSDVLLLTRVASRRRQIVKVLRQTDAVVVVSRHLGAKVEELGISPEKVLVWYQGVDQEKFYPGDRADARSKLGLSNKGSILLWVGSMVPVKKLDLLISALDQVRRRIPNVHLYMVGDGPQKMAIKAQIKHQGLESAATFVGPLLHDQLGDWYRAADLTVLSSDSEGIPNVLRESLACGTPFVSTDVGGIREIARGTGARLVPRGDADALADAITSALNEPAPAHQDLSRSVSWQASAKALIEELQPLISKSQWPNKLRLTGEAAPEERNGDSTPRIPRRPLNVFITIDTEMLPPKPWIGQDLQPDYHRDIEGVTRDGNFGLDFQLDLLARHGLKAVFFVEALFGNTVGLDFLRRITETIQGRGQEVQLHVHPEWLVANDSLLPGRRGDYLKDFSESEQAVLIAKGLENLRECGVPQITAFRAPSYSANFDTLKVLSQIGIPYDTSHNTCYLTTSCALDTGKAFLQPASLCGIYEFPVSYFIDFPGHARHAQLTACSTSELQNALLSAWRQGWYSFVLVSHSFELIHRFKGTGKVARRDSIVIRRFQQLCRFLEDNRDKFRTIGFGDVNPSDLPCRNDFVPIKCGVGRATYRYGEQLARRCVSWMG